MIIVNKKVLKFFFALLILLLANYSFSQKAGMSEAELKTKANEYYKKTNYDEALPLYSQLLSLYSKDPIYNLRFGVCLMFADRRDVEKPLKYLELAVKSPNVDNEVYFYLGYAYHLNYRFKEAITSYYKFKEKASGNEVKQLNVNRLIDMCLNGTELLRNITDIKVLRKIEVSDKDFFRSYDINKGNGKLLQKPNEFKSNLDKKKEETSIIFLSNSNEMIYFSSYGKDGKTDKDIYRIKKSNSGQWNQLERLPNTINTEYEEDYPYITPDGKTLYFCSKGHNSMGGYDIFKSYFDDKTNTWSAPLNIDFAINSPFDDILFIPDSAQENAYFSSNRENSKGKITVYKVKIDKRPIVKENFVVEATNTANPNEDTEYIKKIKYLKDLASLNVNAKEETEKPAIIKVEEKPEEVKKELVQAEEPEEEPVAVQAKVTNEDLLKIANEQLNDKAKDLKEIRLQKQTATTIAENKKIEAQKTVAEANRIIQNAQSIIDGEQKEAEFNRAKDKKLEAEILNKDAAFAANIAKQLTAEETNKQKQLEEAGRNVDDVNRAIKSKRKDSTIAILKRVTERMKNEDSSESEATAVNFNEEQQKYIQKQNEANEDVLKAKKLKEEANSIESEINKNNELFAKTKDKYQKADLQTKNKELTEQKESKNNEAFNLISTAKEKQKQADQKQAEVNSKNLVLAEIKSNSAQKPIETKEKREIEQPQVVKQTQPKTNEEVIAKAIKYAESLNKLSANQKATAGIYYALSNDKTQQAIEKNKQVGRITNEIQTANASEKQNKIKQLEFVKAQVVKIENDAIVIFELGNNLEKNSKKNSEEASKIMNIAKESQTLFNNGNSQQVESKLAEIRNKIIKARIDTTNKYPADDVLVEKRQQYFEKQNEYREAKQENENTFKKYTALQNESKKLRNQANGTADKAAKAKLLARADKIKKDADAQKELYEISKDNNSKLEVEVNKMKMEVDLTYLIEANAKQYTKAELDKTDKDRLVQRIADYKNKEQNNTQLVIANKNELAKTEQKENPIDVKTETNLEVTKAETNKTVEIKQPVATTTTTVTKAISVGFTDLNVDYTKYKLAENNLNIIKSDIDNVNERLKTAENPFDIKNLEKKKVELNILLGTQQKQTEELRQKYEITKAANNDQVPQEINPDTIARKMDKEAQSTLVEVGQIRKSAQNISDPEEQQKVLQKAYILEKQANTKQMQSLELSLVNQQSNFYEKNDNIDKLRVDASIFSRDQLTTAKLLEEDAIKLFNKSQQESMSIKLDSFNTSKREKYSNANLYIQKAIEKQNKAIAIYKQVRVNDSINGQLHTTNISGEDEIVKQDVFTTNSKLNISIVGGPQKENKANKTNKKDKKQLAKAKKGAEIKPEVIDTAVKYNLKTTKDLIADNNQPKKNNKKQKDANPEVINNFEVINDQPIKPKKKQKVKQIETQQEVVADNQPVKIKRKEVKNLIGIEITTKELDKNYYDDKNPIPLNPKLPDGVIYKVQIGAFKKKIDQTVFKGFRPITGEVGDRGFTRYFAGEFSYIKDANAAKKIIRKMGYKDAFIVAFNNGVRTNNLEAVAAIVANQTTQPLNLELKNNNNETQTTDNDNNIASIKGLFYSVQVGVLARKVTSANYFNIEDLYYERYNNKAYRYISGIYKNGNDAIAAKNNIIAKGVKDAFVVAYYNGKKIPLNEARTIQGQSIEDIVKKISDKADIMMNNAAEPTNGKVLNTDSIKRLYPEKQQVIFKVQIGAYRNDVPLKVVDLFLKISSEGIEHIKTDNGLTIYTAGKFATFEQATELKNKLSTVEGYKDSFVVAFYKGQKIPVNVAREIVK